MLSVQGDLGEELFKGWTDEQKRDEIGRLVAGFRAGLPIGMSAIWRRRSPGESRHAVIC
jgi:hypothetical protein